MAGCSKEVVRDSHNPNEEPWVSDLSLPVPIEFGASGFQFETKADKIEKDEALINKQLRLFAFDKYSKVTTEQNDTKSSLFVNEKAYVNEDCKVVFGDVNESTPKTWYYPYASTYNYNFYAFYTGVEEPVIIKATQYTSLFTKIDLNETQSDILWAKATAKTYGIIDGFSAKYMRAVKGATDLEDAEKDEYLPNLEFKHLTTALTFKFKTISSGRNDDTDEQLSNVKVTSLELSNIPAKINLWIADDFNSATSKEGTLSVQTGQESSYPVKMNCDTLTQTYPVGTEQTLGTLFVMVPDGVEEITANMVVSVPLTSGGKVTDVPVKLTLKNKEEDGKFKVSSEYTYLIEMKSLEKMEFKFTVSGWNDGKEGDSEGLVIE